MTLFIACLIIAGLHMPAYLYVVAVVVWMAHLAAWDRVIEHAIESLKFWHI
jgi:hypothetical protein